MKHEFLNLVSIARNNVIESMKDGYMVIDKENHVLDINPVAFELVGQTGGYARGRSLNELFMEKIEAFSEEENEDASQGVIFSETKLQKKYFKPSISSLRFGRFGECKLIVFHDITETYTYGEALKEANKKINFMTSIIRYDLLNQVNCSHFG